MKVKKQFYVILCSSPHCSFSLALTTTEVILTLFAKHATLRLVVRAQGHLGPASWPQGCSQGSGDMDTGRGRPGPRPGAGQGGVRRTACPVHLDGDSLRQQLGDAERRGQCGGVTVSPTRVSSAGRRAGTRHPERSA